MSIPKCRRQTSCGFSDDLEVVNDPGLKEFVTFEGVFSAGGVFFDSFNRFLDVQESLKVASQSGTASARTRARIRGRKPASVTTSTFRPRRFWRSMRRPP